MFNLSIEIDPQYSGRFVKLRESIGMPMLESYKDMYYRVPGPSM